MRRFHQRRLTLTQIIEDADRLYYEAGFLRSREKDAKKAKEVAAKKAAKLNAEEATGKNEAPAPIDWANLKIQLELNASLDATAEVQRLFHDHGDNTGSTLSMGPAVIQAAGFDPKHVKINPKNPIHAFLFAQLVTPNRTKRKTTHNVVPPSLMNQHYFNAYGTVISDLAPHFVPESDKLQTLQVTEVTEDSNLVLAELSNRLKEDLAKTLGAEAAQLIPATAHLVQTLGQLGDGEDTQASTADLATSRNLKTYFHIGLTKDELTQLTQVAVHNSLEYLFSEATNRDLQEYKDSVQARVNAAWTMLVRENANFSFLTTKINENHCEELREFLGNENETANTVLVAALDAFIFKGSKDLGKDLIEFLLTSERARLVDFILRFAYTAPLSLQPSAQHTHDYAKRRASYENLKKQAMNRNKEIAKAARRTSQSLTDKTTKLSKQNTTLDSFSNLDCRGKTLLPALTTCITIRDDLGRASTWISQDEHKRALSPAQVKDFEQLVKTTKDKLATAITSLTAKADQLPEYDFYRDQINNKLTELGVKNRPAPRARSTSSDESDTSVGRRVHPAPQEAVKRDTSPVTVRQIDLAVLTAAINLYSSRKLMRKLQKRARSLESSAAMVAFCLRLGYGSRTMRGLVSLERQKQGAQAKTVSLDEVKNAVIEKDESLTNTRKGLLSNARGTVFNTSTSTDVVLHNLGIQLAPAA